MIAAVFKFENVSGEARAIILKKNAADRGRERQLQHGNMEAQKHNRLNVLIEPPMLRRNPLTIRTMLPDDYQQESVRGGCYDQLCPLRAATYRGLRS